MSPGAEEFFTEPGALAISMQCAVPHAEDESDVCGPSGTMEANFEGSFDGTLVVGIAKMTSRSQTTDVKRPSRTS